MDANTLLIDLEQHEDLRSVVDEAEPGSEIRASVTLTVDAINDDGTASFTINDILVESSEAPEVEEVEDAEDETVPNAVALVFKKKGK